MHDAVAVQILQYVDDLSHIAHPEPFRKAFPILLNKLSKLPQLTILHSKVQFNLILKGILQLDDPLMLDGSEYLFLDKCLVLFLLALEFLF
jgi:hypothetical protein